jgi:hypothetical protein
VTHTIAKEVRSAGERPATVAAASRAPIPGERAMDFELVKVIDRSTLLNPVQLQCPYRTRTGRPLERGIYAVVWPAHVPAHDYDSEARYFGPFRAWRDASAFVRDTIGVRP